jgi:20S proteasome alpha/beta subunit
VTVCIAAICQGPMIVLASDRQYTQEHWKREPAFTKHFSFGKHAVALFSGSISDCLTMCRAGETKMGSPASLDTRQIAECLAEAFFEYRRAEAERGLLAPIGLTLRELTTNTTLSPTLRDNLIDEMRRWETRDSFIVAGIDPGGVPHIYSVSDPGWAVCQDGSGFVAVGSGADHAEALFLRQNYDPNWSPARAVFLAYSAKRHAEVDPFVGLHTDLYLIGPRPYEYAPLHEELKKSLQQTYEESVIQELQRTGETYRSYEDNVVKFLKTQQQSQAEPAGEIQAGSPDDAIPGQSGENAAEGESKGGQAEG